MKKNNNVIPRKFYGIIGKMKEDNEPLRKGDILHITKNSSGYLALDKTNHNSYYYVSVNILRDPDLFEIISIDK